MEGASARAEGPHTPHKQTPSQPATTGGDNAQGGSDALHNHFSHYELATHVERTPPYSEVHVSSDELQDFMETTFATRYMAQPIAKHTLPRHGAPANVVYQLIRDLRALDARPILNVASFVTTWMEPQCEALMTQALDVNFVDAAEYPSSTKIANRCVSMLAKLFHSPAVPDHGHGNPVGTATVGSSEAIMLGGLSLKKRWQAWRRSKGLDTARPNLVMSSATHVCWEKFCRYWDVEARYAYAEEGRYSAGPDQLRPLCDDNTIGVAALLGTTFTGEFDDIEGIDAMIGELNTQHGWQLAIHVDAALGGFIAPFIYPDLRWDFRLRNVASINASGHKYGLVYPGVGWVIWRDEAALPEEMVFLEDYLGTVERSITLNFSRGASQIIAQYYQFLRLGFEGYRKVITNIWLVCKRVRFGLERTGHFDILSKHWGTPVVAFKLKDAPPSPAGDDGPPHASSSTPEEGDGQPGCGTPGVAAMGGTSDTAGRLRQYNNTSDTAGRLRQYDEYALADRLRMRGWVVPAYSLPPRLEHVKVLRVTVREDLSMQMADVFVQDIEEAVKWLDAHYIFTDEQMRQIRQNLAAAHVDAALSLRRPGPW